MTRLDELHKNAGSPGIFWTDYGRVVADVLSDIDGAQIAALVLELDACRKRGGTVWFFGNGGKAALAAEWVNDLTVALPKVKPAFRCGAPACNVVALTAAANDHGYPASFAVLVRAHLREGDLAVFLSGSGMSTNVLQGLEASIDCGVRTVGIGRGGMLQRAACVFVKIPAEDDGPTEDAMMCILHAVHNWFKRAG